MGTHNVYFPSEVEPIIAKMGRGELSTVCQKAVQEWDSYTENLEVVKNKIQVLEEQDAINKTALAFLKERFAKLIETEGERKLREEREKIENENAAEEELERSRLDRIELVCEKLKGLSEKEVTDIKEEMINKKLSNSRKIESFLKEKGFSFDADSWGYFQKKIPNTIQKEVTQ